MERINDYEHRVKRIIDAHKDDNGFPQMADYGVTKETLDEYLFNKQVILDSDGSPKRQLTEMGILVVLPVLVLSALPYEQIPGGTQKSLFYGIAIGLVLALFDRLVWRMVKKIRLHRLYNADMEKYINKVLNF